jgi:hypothetical protein
MDLHRDRRRAARARVAVRAVAANAAAVVIAVSLLAGCGATSSDGHSPDSPPRRAGNPAWLLTRAALSRLTADPAVSDTLRRSQVLEILQPGQQPLAQVSAQPVVIFTSVTALADAVRGGRLPAGTYAVLFDPEAWSFTPPAEQRAPVQAATRAAAVAHAHGLRLIVAPALNLTEVLAPGDRQPRWRVFLDLKLPGRLARVADALELQAQSLERQAATYAAFVRAARAQASAANPRIQVLAGLSTNPPGVPVDSRDLRSAIQATRSIVTGYWLNIPGQSARCPTCNGPRPDIAIQTLQTVR